MFGEKIQDRKRKKKEDEKERRKKEKTEALLVCTHHGNPFHIFHTPYITNGTLKIPGSSTAPGQDLVCVESPSHTVSPVV
jgi:hypothetical protein